MLDLHRRGFGIACSLMVLAGAATATQEAREEKRDELRTEVLKIERMEAKEVLVTVRVIAGAREIDVLDTHTLSVHDTPGTLLLARKVVEMVDCPDSSRYFPSVYEVGDGTTIAAVALRHASAREAGRMLMSEIGIRKVASAEAISTVIVRDSPEQVERALALMRDFDRQAGA